MSHGILGKQTLSHSFSLFFFFQFFSLTTTLFSHVSLLRSLFPLPLLLGASSSTRSLSLGGSFTSSIATDSPATFCLFAALLLLSLSLLFSSLLFSSLRFSFSFSLSSKVQKSVRLSRGRREGEERDGEEREGEDWKRETAAEVELRWGIAAEEDV